MGDPGNCKRRDLTCVYSPNPLVCSDSAYTAATSSGQWIYIIVGCGSASSNCFYVKNTTTNTFYSQQFGPNSSMGDGECIAERPLNDQSYPLPDFGSVAFDHCRLSVSSTPTGATTEYGIGNIPGQTLDGWFYGGNTGVDTNPYCMAPTYPTAVDSYGPTNFTIYDNAPSLNDC